MRKLTTFKSAAEVLEITAVWRGTVLAVEHLDEAQRFTIGAGTQTDLAFTAPGLDDRVPFVIAEVVEGVRRINIPGRASARYLSVDGQVSDVREGSLLVPHPTLLGVQVLQLAKGARAHLRLGELTLVCATVPGARANFGARPRLDRGTARGFGIALGLHALFALLAYSVPVMADGLRLDQLEHDTRWVSVMLTPDVSPAEPTPVQRDGAQDASGTEQAETELAQDTQARPVRRDQRDRGTSEGRAEDLAEARARGKRLARDIAMEALTDGGFTALIETPMGATAVDALAQMDGTRQGTGLGFGGFEGIGVGRVGTGRRGPVGGSYTVAMATKGGTRYRPGRRPGHGRAKKPMRVPPRVTAREPVVSDGLSRAEIQRVVRRMRRQYEACYNKQLQKERDLNGKLTLKFTIGGQGQVLKAGIVRANSTLNHPQMERCMVKRVKRWVFPAPRGNGLVVVNYPFIFRSNR